MSSAGRSSASRTTWRLPNCRISASKCSMGGSITSFAARQWCEMGAAIKPLLARRGAARQGSGMASEHQQYDVLIIGSGAAGLTAALTLAIERKVLVLAKGPLTSGSTAWAQGGIAAVLDAGDTFEDHIRDT